MTPKAFFRFHWHSQLPPGAEIIVRMTTYKKQHLVNSEKDSAGKLVMESILETKAATILRSLRDCEER